MYAFGCKCMQNMQMHANATENERENENENESENEIGLLSIANNPNQKKTLLEKKTSAIIIRQYWRITTGQIPSQYHRQTKYGKFNRFLWRVSDLRVAVG